MARCVRGGHKLDNCKQNQCPHGRGHTSVNGTRSHLRILCDREDNSHKKLSMTRGVLDDIRVKTIGYKNFYVF